MRYTNDQLYIPVYSQGDRVWISHFNELILVHELGMPELRITMPFNHAAFTDDRLFLQDDDRLYILNTGR